MTPEWAVSPTNEKLHTQGGIASHLTNELVMSMSCCVTHMNSYTCEMCHTCRWVVSRNTFHTCNELLRQCIVASCQCVVAMTYSFICCDDLWVVAMTHSFISFRWLVAMTCCDNSCCVKCVTHVNSELCDTTHGHVWHISRECVWHNSPTWAVSPTNETWHNLMRRNTSQISWSGHTWMSHITNEWGSAHHKRMRRYTSQMN